MVILAVLCSCLQRCPCVLCRVLCVLYGSIKGGFGFALNVRSSVRGTCGGWSGTRCSTTMTEGVVCLHSWRVVFIVALDNYRICLAARWLVCFPTGTPHEVGIFCGRYLIPVPCAVVHLGRGSRELRCASAVAKGERMGGWSILVARAVDLCVRLPLF